MPDTFYHFVNQLTFRRPKLSRLSAFASFYPALREHIETIHRQCTTALTQLRNNKAIVEWNDSHARNYILTEIDNCTDFVDALSELCVRYAYNILITGKTTFSQFLTRLDTLLTNSSLLHQSMEDWMKKPLLKSITTALHNLVHPSTGILHSFVASVFSGKITSIIDNIETVLGTMHSYTTFDDCIQHMFTTQRTMMTTPMTLKLARSKLRSVMGDGAWAERETYYQLARSVLLIPKELMECLVVEIQAQLRVDNELFECFPHYYTPSSDLSTFQRRNSRRFSTRKSHTRMSAHHPTKRRGLFGRLFGKSRNNVQPIATQDRAPPSQHGGADEHTPPSLQPHIPQSLQVLRTKARTFDMSSIQDTLSHYNQRKSKSNTSPQQTTDVPPTERKAQASSQTTDVKEPPPTGTPTTPHPSTQLSYKPSSPNESKNKPETQPETNPEQPTPNKPPKPSPRRKSYTTVESPDDVTPKSLQEAWQHQKEAEANTREVMQKLSVATVTGDAKQSWWKRMKSRVYTFSRKKDNIEFLGLSMLQFTPMQLLCAYLTPLHLHYEGWSDQLTLVAMMYHMQTLDLLPSITNIGSGSLANESYCTHVKDLPLAKTLSSTTRSTLSNRQSKCTTRSLQLHDDYCSTVASLREESYPVATLLKSKRCRQQHKGGRRSRRRGRHSRKKQHRTVSRVR